MKVYIVLLRGINVSGQKKVPMAELQTLLLNLGFKNVRTYIQSGNVVLQSSKEESHKIEDIIKKGILNHFGFEVSTLVKTAEELRTIFTDCSFVEEKKEKSYFTLLHSIPDKNLVEEVLQNTYPNEEFNIVKDCVYFFSAIGYGRAKCNNNFFERKLKITATTRNYKTMVKLLSLSEDYNK